MIPVLFKKIGQMAFSQFMKVRTFSIKVQQVTDSREFEAIHSFNYRIFVEELGQYPSSPEKRRVDAYHDFNTYFIAKKNNSIIGMICVTRPNESGFSVQKKMKDPTKLDVYRNNGVEIRLLAIQKAHRGSGLFWKLARAVVNYLMTSPIEVCFISGISEREGMYRHLGFEAMDEACQSGKSWFIPMKLTRERFIHIRPYLGL